ncbi:MAG: hypothetical protein CL816_06845, partial [Coxiellaceae bacterium]|nr:hypothetical protein [Coxiellaceae bacterium]
MNGKIIGANFLVAGTAIGAGMMALPIACADTGFIPGLCILVVIWCLMIYSALLVLEVNLTLDTKHNSFSSMARQTLGRPAQVIAWICMLLLLYSLTAAYISGNASIIQLLIQTLFDFTVPYWINAIVFLLVFGSAVIWSTRCADLVNRLFFSLKGITLIVSLGLLLPETHFEQLNVQHLTLSSAFMAPIFITAFAFHTVIPSLTLYIGRKAKTLRMIVLCGGSLPLIIYAIWLITTLGIIPINGPNSFNDIHYHQDSVSLFISHLTGMTDNVWVHIGIHGFANIAMVTSFLGVTLGLFDFLADGLNRKNDVFGRVQTGLLTFLPPLFFALIYPHGFMLALQCAAIFVAILEMILPACMAYRSRQQRLQQNQPL